jgi:hypothetical protein
MKGADYMCDGKWGREKSRKKGLFVRERMNKESKEMAGGQGLEPR